MYLIWWITVGLVVGWLSGRALKGYGYGPLMGIGMGVCGAVAGGFLMQSAGINGGKGTIATVLVAILAAILVTHVAGVVNGRWQYARQPNTHK
jgi:uncharacterized membrane protein YeaQ/YmgE (transglycosylase-associated protein family)